MMQRAVFLDRDGVINKSDVRDGKPYAPTRFDDFVILPEARTAASQLKNTGYLLIVVTNQPDVGNGHVNRHVVERMNKYLLDELPLDEIKCCFHSQNKGCLCRKPAAGMLLDARDELNIDLSNSFMVGDRWSDIEAGKKANCKTIFIDRNYKETKTINADYVCGNVLEAAEYILTSRKGGLR